MNNQRMKWDAEAAFKRIDEQILNDEPCERAAADRNEMAGFSYEPPSNIGPERLAQLRKYEPPAKHGRDIESLMRYHEAHKKPVGYWEDAPRGMKFGGGDDKPIVKAADGPIAGGTPAAPTTTPPADGPWPKYALSPSHERKGLSVVYIQAEAGGTTTAYYTDGTKMRHRASNGVLAFGAICTDIGVIIRALEQNGHADVAAQLRGRDEFEPVGTISVVGDVVRCSAFTCADGADRRLASFHYPSLSWVTEDRYNLPELWFANGECRILKRPTKPRDDVATGARAWTGSNRCVRVWVGARMMIRGRDGEWAESRMCVADLDAMVQQRDKGVAEIVGPERDVIVAECRKAMGI